MSAAGIRAGLAALLLVLAEALSVPAQAQEVRLNSVGRFDGWRDNALIGYGLVVGLAGSGDSRRSGVTRQALQNVLSRLGTQVTEEQISSRNAAVVVVIATLPASANVGDRLSVTVSSIGDARSLAGGTLLMTPLLGPDRHTYALAQGPLLAGGHSFESDLNLNRRNYPTTVRLEQGATVEAAVHAQLLHDGDQLAFLLNEPSFTTAERIAVNINHRFGRSIAWARSADEVRIYFQRQPYELAGFISELENISVMPDLAPRIIINERTGTVVAGGDVTVSSVVVSQGDIKVTIQAETYASQPAYVRGPSRDIASLIVTNTDLEVEQGDADVVATFPNSTVSDLVEGLARAGVDTRRMISILQAMKAAGAIHAEIIVQ